MGPGGPGNPIPGCPRAPFSPGSPDLPGIPGFPLSPFQVETQTKCIKYLFKAHPWGKTSIRLSSEKIKECTIPWDPGNPGGPGRPAEPGRPGIGMAFPASPFAPTKVKRISQYLHIKRRLKYLQMGGCEFFLKG